MLNFSIMTTAYKVVMYRFQKQYMIRDYKFRSTQSTSLHRFFLRFNFRKVNLTFFHKDMLLYTKILLGLQCTNLKFLYLDFRGGQLTRYHHSHSGISIPINLNPFGLQKALCTSKQAPTQKRDSFRHNYIPSCL